LHHFNPHEALKGALDLSGDGAVEVKGADEAPEQIVTKALADLTKTVDDRIAAIEKKSTDTAKLVERLDKIEAKQNRPATSTVEPIEPALETKAFASFARRGVEKMDPLEVKALTVSVDAAGGYLAPEGFLTELQKNLVLFSPVRSVARVATASAGEILLPKRTGTLTAAWVGETAARSSTQPAYGQQKFVMHELACYVDVSNRLLEDAAFDIEGELALDLAEEFGRAESAAFISGDGTDKPNGILANTDIEAVEIANVAGFTADAMIDLFHALPSFYAANGVWAMNRATIARVRKMKDTTGAYIWQESIAAGNPATILGRPVVEFPDMPDADEDTIPVIFGDFRQAFRIVDHTAVSVLRDPYSVQTSGQVRFHARKRVGAAVSKAEALKFLKIDAV
jgi:HK97 family phage major capsid protein